MNRTCIEKVGIDYKNYNRKENSDCQEDLLMILEDGVTRDIGTVKPGVQRKTEMDGEIYEDWS